MTFDTANERVIVSATIKIRSFYLKAFGCPRIGENRETGENPVRSRHCDEALLAAKLARTEFPSQETCPEALQLLNARGNAFRPPGFQPFSGSRRSPVAFLRSTGMGGIFAETHLKLQTKTNSQGPIRFGVGRQPIVFTTAPYL